MQVKASGAPHWNLAQRTAAIGRNGAKLLAVGFFASLFGVTITNGIVEVRGPPTQEPPVASFADHVALPPSPRPMYMSSPVIFTVVV